MKRGASRLKNSRTDHYPQCVFKNIGVYTKKPPCRLAWGFGFGSLAVPYFRMGVHTIIGAGRFHFRGRDGIGWFPPAMAARQFVAAPVFFLAGPPCRGGASGRPPWDSHTPGAVRKFGSLEVSRPKRKPEGAAPARFRRPLGCCMAKPHGQLVPVSCTRCRASTPGLSTWWSSRALQGALGPREASSWEGLPA